MDVLKRPDIIYPELSYQIVGILFNVHKEMGHGFLERYYQKAIAVEFEKNSVDFKEQVRLDLI